MRKILSIIGLIILLWFHFTAPACGKDLADGGLLFVLGTMAMATTTVLSGFAARAEAKQAAALAEYNATVAEREGQAKEAAKEREAEIFQMHARELEAEQVAAYGKSGVTFRGSPLTVMAETAKNLEIDRQTILQEGRLARQFSEYEATGHRMEASAYRTKGRYAMLSGIGKGTGTMLLGMSEYKRKF
jgi:hypothetical protein